MFVEYYLNKEINFILETTFKREKGYNTNRAYDFNQENFPNIYQNLKDDYEISQNNAVNQEINYIFSLLGDYAAKINANLILKRNWFKIACNYLQTWVNKEEIKRGEERKDRPTPWNFETIIQSGISNFIMKIRENNYKTSIINFKNKTKENITYYLEKSLSNSVSQAFYELLSVDFRLNDRPHTIDDQEFYEPDPLDINKKHSNIPNPENFIKGISRTVNYENELDLRKYANNLEMHDLITLILKTLEQMKDGKNISGVRKLNLAQKVLKLHDYEKSDYENGKRSNVVGALKTDDILKYSYIDKDENINSKTAATILNDIKYAAEIVANQNKLGHLVRYRTDKKPNKNLNV